MNRRTELLDLSIKRQIHTPTTHSAIRLLKELVYNSRGKIMRQWWCLPVIAVLDKMRHGPDEFEASLSSIVRHSVKNKTNNKIKIMLDGLRHYLEIMGIKMYKSNIKQNTILYFYTKLLLKIDISYEEKQQVINIYKISLL